MFGNIYIYIYIRDVVISDFCLKDDYVRVSDYKRKKANISPNKEIYCVLIKLFEKKTPR